MSTFRENLRVIPRAVWIIALILYIGAVIGIHFGVTSDPQMSQWPLVGQLAFNLLIPLFIFLPFAFFGYIYGDAKRRHMNAIGWTLLAIFVPYLIGVILYFLLRDPLPINCPGCQSSVPSKFTFCPNCGKPVSPRCPQCGKAVQHAWANCGYCGTKLPT
jgi:hypothetical protein